MIYTDVTFENLDKDWKGYILHHVEFLKGGDAQ